VLYTTAVYGPQVSVGGVTFNKGPDVNGVEWIISEESGWYSTAGIKTTRAEKSSALGVVRMLEYKGGRSIAFNGTILAPGIGLLRRAQDQLLGVCPLPDVLYPVQVTDESGVTYTANVAIDGQIITKALSAFSVAFSLQLFAPDPRRFGTQRTATVFPGTTSTGGVTYPVTYPVSYGAPGNTGSATLTNAGTAYADIMFTLVGPLTKPVIRNNGTGDQLTYNGNIPSGATVVINTASGSVLYNGSTNYRALLTANQWFSIPAGGTIGVAFSTSNSGDAGYLGITYSDSYY
jgi:hypothetical protein